MVDVYVRLKLKNSGLTPYCLVKKLYSKVIQLTLNIAPIQNGGSLVRLEFKKWRFDTVLFGKSVFTLRLFNLL